IIGFCLCAYHYESRDHIRTFSDHLQDDVSTYRYASDDGLFNLEFFQKLNIVFCNLLHGMIVRVERRITMARHVGCNATVSQLKEMCKLREPHVFVMSKTVYKQNRYAGATVVVRDRLSVAD